MFGGLSSEYSNSIDDSVSNQQKKKNINLLTLVRHEKT